MKLETVPRKHKKHVRNLLEAYEKSDFENLTEFLRYQYVGTIDGWISTNNAEYQALLYIIRENNNILVSDSFGEGD